MNNRIVGIDVIKGISIMLVVIYHTITSSYISPVQFLDFLSAFLLNAFFFAAGWVYAYSKNNNNYKIKIKRKIVALGIPYILLSVFAIVYQFIVGTVFGNNFISDTYHGKQLLLRNLYCAFSLTGIGTLWFLPVILIANIVLIYLIKKTEKCKNQTLIMGLVCLIMYLFYVFVICRIDINITNTTSKIIFEEVRFLDRIVIGCVYIVMGYIANKILSKLNFGNIANLFIGVAFLVLGAVLYHFELEFYKVLYTLAETLIIIHLCNYRWAAILTKPVSYLGENSLYIMVIHYIFVQPVVMKMIWGSYYFMNTPLFTKRIVLFFVVLAVTLIITEIGKRVDDILFLFGKGERFKELQKRILRRS